MSRSEHRYCVVTPYYREERHLLDRCIASVRRQSPHVDHILVADGFPQPWLDSEPVRHIKLDRSHGDFGNAARGLGAMLAIAEGYRGIAFLDADNWFDDDHVAACLEAARTTTSDPAYVIAQRRFCRPDGSTMTGTPADLPHSNHVDTNCFLFLPGAFTLLHRWCTMPNALSAFGDQIFGKILRAAALPSVLVPRRTVNYLCLSEQIYQILGEVPPPGSKPQVSWADAQTWIYTLPEAGARHLERMTGLTMGEIGSFDEATTAPSGEAVATNLLHVEIPGSRAHAFIRRTDADIATYKRVFVAEDYADVGLPESATLIVDLAAGIGLTTLWLHTRYPGARIVALEADIDRFEILSENLMGRTGCQAVRGRLADGHPSRKGESEPDRRDPGRLAPPPPCSDLTLVDLMTSAGDAPIDLLLLTQEQWSDLSRGDLSRLDRIRAVMVDRPNGVEVFAPSRAASRETPTQASQPRVEATDWRDTAGLNPRSCGLGAGWN